MKRIESLEGLEALVTGAAGFIGSHLCARLAEGGVGLYVLVRPGRSTTSIPGRPAPPAGCRILEADITDGRALREALSRTAPDLVFHLAALTDVRRDPALGDPCGQVNLQGTLNLARALKGSRARRVIHLGTCEEYGDGRAPFREEDLPRPVSPYSATKAAATLHMQKLGQNGELPVVVLRPFLTYGPGQHPSRFMAQAIDAALTGRPFPMTPGEQTREFNHVDDVVGGILKAACLPGLEGEIINLASGDERPLREVAELVFRLAGAKSRPEPGALPYREGEAMRFFGSTEKCRRLLGYVPERSLEEGMKSLIAWERVRRQGG